MSKPLKTERRIYWRPASRPPTELTICLFKGQNYVVSEGIWWGGSETKSAGFYLQVGESFFTAPWVEWWIEDPLMPEPSEPNSLVTSSATI